MKQEHGRLRPANRKETSSIRRKTFHCSVCNIEEARKITFGEEVKCDSCGETMVEVQRTKD